MIQSTHPMSAADVAAHEAASHVRRPSDQFVVDYDRGFGAENLVPLANVPVDAAVTVSARIVGARTFPGRLRLVVADSDGAELAIVIPSAKANAAYRQAGRGPQPGDRIQLRGHVTQQTPQMSKSVAGYAMRVVA